MYDAIETVGQSIVQHGGYNDRIYLMKLAAEDAPGIITALDTLAASEGYSKVFAKVPASALGAFIEHGYVVEAHVPGFFNGVEDAYFMGKYRSRQRRRFAARESIDKIIELAKLKTDGWMMGELPSGYHIRVLAEGDIAQVVELYLQVFDTYPFPIYDPEYIRETMHDHIVYFGVFVGNTLVAVSSSEIDTGAGNVEMTDFATLPEHRGQGLAAHLLREMEEKMRTRGMRVAYTIARAPSLGINTTFARMGYRYGGTLVNNTNISGSFESMNVWYKRL